MRMSNINMTTTVDRLKLLQTLRLNRTTHSKIVQEARNGYIKQAQEVLSARLEQLRTGEVGRPVDLSTCPFAFRRRKITRRSTIIALPCWNGTRWKRSSLQPMNSGQLVRDEWDWSDTFLAGNAAYSQTARVTMQAKKK